jgi:hypothetical protein
LVAQKLNCPKFSELMKKWEKELSRAFSQEKVQMAKKHVKKYSKSLAIREM